jgi:hypothetical protein
MHKFFPNVRFEITDEDKKKTLIFYGAGKYAKINTKYWIEDGFTPVIFADKNPEKYTETIDGIEITSLDDAMSRFPDSLIVLGVAPELVSKTTEYLIGIGIDESVIKYPEKLIWRKGCFFGNSFQLYRLRVKECRQRMYSINKNDDFNTMISKHRDYYEKEMIKYIDNTPVKCDTCFSSDPNYYSKNPTIKWICLGTGFNGDKCNYRCYNCASSLDIPIKNQLDSNGLSLFAIIKRFIEYLNEDKRRMDNFERFELCNAEPTLNPEINLSLEILKNNNLKTLIHTNAYIYNQLIAEMMRVGLATIQVDISAGTNETYEKVKRVDGFETIIKNLELYNTITTQIIVKYTLFEGINDNLSEIKKLIDRIKHLNFIFSLSKDSTYGRGQTDEEIPFLNEIINYLTIEGIMFTLYLAVLSKSDLALEKATKNGKYIEYYNG